MEGDDDLDPRWFDASCGRFESAEAYEKHLAEWNLQESTNSNEEEEDNMTKNDVLIFKDIVCTRQELEDLLGSLTESVRNDWSDADDRVDLIRDICIFLEQVDWASVVDSFYDCSDGRVFRDAHCDIPYGNSLLKDNPFYAEYHALVCFECRTGYGVCSDEENS